MKYLNVPNSITLLRIAFAPVFIVLLLSSFPYSNLVAAALFLLLSLTDFIDGYLARKRSQVTDVGKILDPIADKLLISIVLVLLIGQGVEWWMALAIIIREVLLTAIRLVMLGNGNGVVIAASWLGKLKTISQIVAITAVLIHFPLSYWLMLGAVIITLVSGIDYLASIRKLTGNDIVNIPNTITLIRMLLIIPFVILVKNANLTGALISFSAIALLDRIDGLFARLSNQHTHIGELFDSSTDWIVILASFATLSFFGYLTGTLFWGGLFFVVLYALSRTFYYQRKKNYASTPLGKIAVGASYAAIISYLISFPYREYVVLGVFACSLTAAGAYFLNSFRRNS